MAVRAVDRAYEVVRDAIISGAIPPGGRIREEALAERAGVSRTPIREALRRLHADGFVVLSANRGARVVEWTADDIRDIFHLRLLLEPYGAECAAREAKPNEIDHLDELAEAMADAVALKSIERVTALNNEFHSGVMAASGNRRLMTMAQGLMHVPLVHRTFHTYSPEEMERSVRQHRELIIALRAGDPGWARSVMSSHVHAGLGQMQLMLATGEMGGNARSGAVDIGGSDDV